MEALAESRVSAKWQELPEDILLLVLQFCDRGSLVALRTVSRAYAEPVKVALFAELHLRPSVASFQRMANIATNKQLSRLVKKIIYHPGGLITHFVGNYEKYELESRRFRAEPSQTQIFRWYGRKSCLTTSIRRMYDLYIEEASSRTLFEKLAESVDFLDRLNYTLRHFSKLASFELSFEGGPVHDHGSHTSDCIGMSFDSLCGSEHVQDVLKSKAGRLLTSISGMRADCAGIESFVHHLRNPTKYLQNLRELQLYLGDIGDGGPRLGRTMRGAQDIASASFALKALLSNSSSLTSLDMSFEDRWSNQTWRSKTEKLSKMVLCHRWPQLHRLTLRGFVCTEEDLENFVEGHAKALRILELKNLTLHAHAEMQPYISRIFATIQSTCALDRVRLRGTFSNGSDERWQTSPSQLRKVTPVNSMLAEVERLLCRREQYPLPVLAECVRRAISERGAEPIDIRYQLVVGRSFFHLSDESWQSIDLKNKQTGQEIGSFSKAQTSVLTTNAMLSLEHAS